MGIAQGDDEERRNKEGRGGLTGVTESESALKIFNSTFFWGVSNSTSFILNSKGAG